MNKINRGPSPSQLLRVLIITWILTPPFARAISPYFRPESYSKCDINLSVFDHWKKEIRDHTQSSVELTDSETRQRLEEVLSKYSIHILTDNRGVLLDHIDANYAEPNRRIEIATGSAAYDLGHTELWRFKGQLFQFLDIGYKNLEADSNVMLNAILDHSRNYPNQSLLIEFGPDRRKLQNMSDLLREYRSTTFDAVLELYSKIKTYLNKIDLFFLEVLNQYSNNTDIFVLLSDDPNGNDEDLSNEQLRNRLLMTIQVSYSFVSRDFSKINPAEILKAAEAKTGEHFTRLPFYMRLISSANSAEAFYQEFVKDFAPVTSVCELTRWAQFSNQIPDGVKDRFLFEAIKAALKRGIRTLVASGDSKTTRLFRRYGFKIYKQIPVGHEKEKEYLSYLSVGSPEFNDLYERLAPTRTRLH
jgi:hypothetical protein